MNTIKNEIACVKFNQCLNSINFTNPLQSLVTLNKIKQF